MSDITINIKMPQYLAQWFINEKGGEPVELDKGSAESKILQIFIAKPPRDYIPETKKEGEVAICIPASRGKDPIYYNYLPQKAQAILVNCIHDRFVIELFTDINKIRNIGLQRKKIIRAWMQTHGIEYSGTNWDAIEKNYLRASNAYRQNQYKERKKSQKIS